MMVVVQPNVVTRDGKVGVQTGEMLLITRNVTERMHAYRAGRPLRSIALVWKR